MKISQSVLALLSFSAAACTGTSTIAQAPANPPAAPGPAVVVPAPAARYSVETTTISDLLSDPAAKAIIDKYIPGFSAHPGLEMGMGMTLRAIKAYDDEGLVTDARLAAIEAELKKL